MIGLFDPLFWILVGPAFLLGLVAQIWVKSAYASAQRLAAPLSGAAAARHILNGAGLQNVDIEQVPGRLSDHYDPRHKVLRLSSEVYQSRSLAAVISSRRRAFWMTAVNVPDTVSSRRRC